MKKILYCALACLIITCSLVGYASPVTYVSESNYGFGTNVELLNVYFINTHGASDAILVTFGDKVMMIDCGDTNYGALYVKPLLDELNITHIDYAYNTHPHDDHINGFISLFDLVEVDTFYTAFPMSYCEEQINVMNAAMKHGIKIVQVDNDSDISFGELKIRLYQDSKYVTAVAASANNASMIMQITYKNSTVMITGDAGKEVYTHLYAAWGDGIRSDIIKMPHHGYNMPSYEIFRQINPSYAVITNFYSEKISESSQFLRNNSCPVIYTGAGTVLATTDGARWTIQRY